MYEGLETLRYALYVHVSDCTFSVVHFSNFPAVCDTDLPGMPSQCSLADDFEGECWSNGWQTINTIF